MNGSSYFSLIFLYIIGLSGKILPAFSACISPENGGFAYRGLQKQPIEYVGSYRKYDNGNQPNVYGVEPKLNYVNYGYAEYNVHSMKRDDGFPENDIAPDDSDVTHNNLRQSNSQSVPTQFLRASNSMPIIPIHWSVNDDGFPENDIAPDDFYGTHNNLRQSNSQSVPTKFLRAANSAPIIPIHWIAMEVGSHKSSLY